MTDLSPIIFASFVGIIAGFIFFGGLWFTTQRLPTWKYPAVWVFGSFMVRASVMLSALYWVGKDHLPRMAACLVGFVIARMVMLYVTREKKEEPSDSEEGNACT